MAISKRNPLPIAVMIAGLTGFFYFGIGSSRDTTDLVTSIPPADVGSLDQSDIDAIAVEAADEADEAEGAGEIKRAQEDDLNAQQKPAGIPTSLQSSEDQRLDLSGTAKRSPDATARKLKSYNGLYDLTFDDVKFDLEPEEPFSADRLTDEIRQIDGQKIKIRGYIRPSFSQRGLKNFVFVRDNKECCFGPNAAIYDCMLVKLKKQTTTDYTVRPVTVEGTFYLKPYEGPDGNTWAIYRMKNATVK